MKSEANQLFDRSLMEKLPAKEEQEYVSYLKLGMWSGS
jgi:hypothetical protein